MIDLRLGDCLEITPTLPANSVDTILTDSPYGIDFMGKEWDRGVPGGAYWREFLRVAKPGAILMAFGGTRTWHRLACAIEDAGWEIRDTIMWVYGSGFPKSHDISKAIDREAGETREVVGIREDFKAKKAAEVRHGTDNGRNYNERHDPGRGGYTECRSENMCGRCYRRISRTGRGNVSGVIPTTIYLTVRFNSW